MLKPNAAAFCPPPTQPADWARHEFAAAQLPDQRLNERLCIIATAFSSFRAQLSAAPLKPKVTQRFRQAITRSIADQVRTIRIPAHMIEVITRLWRAQKQLVQELGHEPTPEEIGDEIDLSVERVRALLEMAQQPISLQSLVGDCEETSVGDFIEDETTDDPAEKTCVSLLRGQLNGVLTSLSEREQEVLELRFGLGDGYSHTREEVGRQYQVTRERIRQIEATALRKMRHPTRIHQLHGFLEVR
jgi:RNA polymerase primary sigma factor